MVVAQIVQFRLIPSRKDNLTVLAARETENWLNKWTPVNNFQAVFSSNENEALEELKEDVRDIIPDWLKNKGVVARDFEFRVSFQEVENGRFWMTTNIMNQKWYKGE